MENVTEQKDNGQDKRVDVERSEVKQGDAEKIRMDGGQVRALFGAWSGRGWKETFVVQMQLEGNAGKQTAIQRNQKNNQK